MYQKYFHLGKKGHSYDDDQGKTALHKAAEKGDLAMIKFLINNGAVTDVKDIENGRTPLHMATIHRDYGRIL